ncbi:MAG: hypothetical protein ACREFB_00120 [Stellaceae bacterium]
MELALGLVIKGDALDIFLGNLAEGAVEDRLMFEAEVEVRDLIEGALARLRDRNSVDFSYKPLIRNIGVGNV